MTCIAHRDVSVNGEVLEQPLVEHLHQTAMDARRMAEHFGAGQLMYAVGLLHDIGKADRRFQKYIRGEISDHVNHSSAGWRYALDTMLGWQEAGRIAPAQEEAFLTFAELVGYVLVTHHGLMDAVDLEKPVGEKVQLFAGRLAYDALGGYHYEEDVLTYLAKVDVQAVGMGKPDCATALWSGFEEFLNIYDQLCYMAKHTHSSPRDARQFYLGMLYRLLLSCLKEADIYDSANAFAEEKQRRFHKDETHAYWASCCARVESLYEGFADAPHTPLNDARTYYAEQAKKAAFSTDAGVYKLEMPTGSGKTMAVLRHAVHYAAAHKSPRIIYLTAFLSVLEQNAAEIRKILGDADEILEHHSNIVSPEEMADESRDDVQSVGRQAYLMECWEAPVILSTLVQFFNAIFKHRARDIRKFRALAGAVIIIDEVQSIPSKMTEIFNLTMHFMKAVMGCHIIHCTATQPVYDSPALRFPLAYGDQHGDKTALVPADTNFACFDRVVFKSLLGETWQERLDTEAIVAHVAETMVVQQSVLLIVNTKKVCKTLYQALGKVFGADEDVGLFYLTTNLCAAHRLSRIAMIKERLKTSGKKTICVSTQLIEAGVDVDFNVVYRSMAGLDRLIQSAGRANREGKMPDKGICYLFVYEEENLSHLTHLQAEADITMQVLREDSLNPEDLALIQVQDMYYNKYYIEHLEALTYPLKGTQGSMLDLLSYNQPKRTSYYQFEGVSMDTCVFAQSFKTAALAFDYIDQNAQTVIVSYDNDTLLEALHEALAADRLKQAAYLLKQLQPYTIQVNVKDAHQAYMQHYEDVGIYILEEAYYKEDCGLSLERMATLLI